MPPAHTGGQRAREKRTAGAAGSAAGSGDPEAARRRAEHRAVRITAGATEREQRLADLLRGRRQAAGGRRQAAGGRRQAAGGRRQAAGGRRQAAGGRRQAAG
ncbi:hypothetical protein RNB18_40825, partial [Streptomyces sp. DSM 41640]|nr:hypothetical protein [Streptomyces sp. DSM 41640]